jgi:hypothetical protein
MKCELIDFCSVALSSFTMVSNGYNSKMNIKLSSENINLYEPKLYMNGSLQSFLFLCGSNIQGVYHSRSWNVSCMATWIFFNSTKWQMVKISSQILQT